MDESKLLNRHMSNTQRKDAQARWEAMRGGAHLQLVEKHLAAGRLDDAAAELASAMPAAEHNAYAQVLAARLNMERGQLARARDAITKAGTLSDDPEIDYIAGILAQRYDNAGQALEHYTQAATKNSYVSEYVLAQAEMLYVLERPIEALELLDARLRDFDRNVPMRTLAARIAQTIGLRDPAVEWWREAVRLSEGDPAIQADYGITLVWAEQYREAIEVLEPLVQAQYHPPAEGTANQISGSPIVSVSSSATRLESRSSDPLPPGMEYALARAYLAERRWEDATRLAQRLLDLDREDETPWMIIAYAAAQNDKYDTAEEALASMTVQRSKSPELLILSAYTSWRRGDAEAAQIAAKAAINEDQMFVGAYCLLGRIQESVGDVHAARRAYEDALAIEPDSTLVRTLLESLPAGEACRPARRHREDIGAARAEWTDGEAFSDEARLDAP